MSPNRRNVSIAALVAPILCALSLSPAFMAGAHAAGVKGSGTSATESRTVASFEAVSVSGSMDLVVRQGDQQVQVQADDNLLPLLETVVESGSRGATLQVRWKKGQWVNTRGKVLVTVTVPKLSAVGLSGSGDVQMGSFNTPAFQLSLSGAGDAKLDGLTTEELGVQISGSGDVSGKGSATRMKVSIAGSGDVRLSDMRSDDVSVSIAGSGDAAVNAQKSLTISIAGSGDVTYTGNASMKSTVAGSGSVTKK